MEKLNVPGAKNINFYLIFIIINYYPLENKVSVNLVEKDIKENTTKQKKAKKA